MNQTNCVRRRVAVANERGLHSRPATVLATTAAEFDASVVLLVEEEGAPEGKRADAKSVLEVLLLGAPAGALVDIEATGPDAQAAVDAIAEVLARASL